MLRAPSIVALAQASLRAGCGNKAANLARLMALGHAVPGGFVVTAREYERHVAAARIDVSADLAEIRRRILATPLSSALRARLRDAAASMRWPVAVRSSAAAEDSGAASFAGQLDSLLGVECIDALEDAVRVVWASRWSQRCVGYARRQGLAPGTPAVIVQRQVEARWSGVLFTRDPLDAARDASVIEYVDGLGDRLVGGAVNPARIRVEDGVVAHDVRGALPGEVARRLARQGRDLERALGAPQDIEWSIDREGRVQLLQARPVTVCAREVWSNANIAENFPDPVTPFLFSIVARGYSAYFRNLALGFGISARRVAAMAPSLERIVGLQGGRLYYNLTSIHAILGLAPCGERLAAAFNRFTGAHEREPTSCVPVSRWERAIEAARVVAVTAWKYLWIHRRVASFEARVDAYAEATRPEAVAARDAAALARDLDGFLHIRLEQWNDAGLADAAAMVCYAALGRVLAGAVEQADADRLQNDLLKGLPGLASARPVAELWKLSREVLADETLAELFRTHDARRVEELTRAPRWQAFRVRFDDYLAIWGVRYSRELMLTSPTPREDPAPMIGILQSYLRDTGPGPEAISAAQARSRLEATLAMARRLSPHAGLRALPFSRAGRMCLVLRATQGAIRLRERARMKQALLYTRLRHVMLRIGEILAERGCLANRDDVFLLTVDELRPLIAQDARTDGIRDRIAARREEHAASFAMQPPDSLTLPRTAAWRADSPRAARPRSEARTLHGTSACGGAFEGAANVIEDVSLIGALRAGEILVTRQTDPGWAAVFFMVKGLVIERGGMLSHGAIIAREYGIPAVVGVNEAMRRIRSGERIRVDGDHGVVELAGR
jgi:pyruvate,water dikinase